MPGTPSNQNGTWDTPYSLTNSWLKDQWFFLGNDDILHMFFTLLEPLASIVESSQALNTQKIGPKLTWAPNVASDTVFTTSILISFFCMLNKTLEAKSLQTFQLSLKAKTINILNYARHHFTLVQINYV